MIQKTYFCCVISYVHAYDLGTLPLGWTKSLWAGRYVPDIIAYIILFINILHSDYVIPRLYNFIYYTYIMQPINEMKHDVHQKTESKNRWWYQYCDMCYTNAILLNIFI